MPLTRFPLLLALLTAPTLASAQMSTFPSPPALAPAPAETPRVTLAPPADAKPSDASPADSSAIEKPAAVPTPPKPVTAGAVVAATLNSMNALDDKVTLGAGDTISYRVIEDEDEAVTRLVTDTGEANFPYIGRVKVDGKTCHQVALEVKKLLEVNYYKEATVIVGLDLVPEEDKQKAKDLVWVVGEVRTVGPMELSKVKPMSVSQIILRSGGFGDFADDRKVKLVHRLGSSAKSETPDLSKIKDGQVIDVKAVFDGKSNVDPIVKDGDYIIVPKKLVNFY